MSLFSIVLYIGFAPLSLYLLVIIRRILGLMGIRNPKRVSWFIMAAWAVLLYFIIRAQSYPVIMALIYFSGFNLIMELINLIIGKMSPAPRESSAADDSHRAKAAVCRGRKVWDFIYRSALVSLAVMAAVMGYGLWNGSTVTETNYSLTTDKLSEPLRIALISDLHLDGTMDGDEFGEYLEEIEAEDVDLLLLCGDLFDESTLRSDMETACKHIGEFTSTYGTYLVMGNHDQRKYKETMNVTSDDEEEDYTSDYMENCLVAAGVEVLHDDVVQIRDDLVLVGRRDYSEGSRSGDEAVSRDTVAELMTRVPQGCYVIMMDHQPRETEDKAAAGVDLVLSGHTHAGQVWPLNLLNDTLFSNDYNYGLHVDGETTTIVSSGIGCWSCPMRTAGRCEWVIIDID